MNCADTSSFQNQTEITALPAGARPCGTTRDHHMSGTSRSEKDAHPPYHKNHLQQIPWPDYSGNKFYEAAPDVNGLLSPHRPAYRYVRRAKPAWRSNIGSELNGSKIGGDVEHRRA